MKLTFMLILSLAAFSCSKKDDDTSDDNHDQLILTGSLFADAASELRVAEEATSGSPSSFKVTFYETYLSPNKDCSEPIQIDDYGDDGKEVELANEESIIENSVTKGTYECVILVINDNLKFKADKEAVADHVGCKSTSTTHVHDIYRAPDEGEEQDGGNFLDINGKEVEGTGTRGKPGEDIITLFASTGAAKNVKPGGNTINEYQYLALDASLTVPGEAVYYWDATDGIKNSTDQDNNNYCTIETVQTGFR